MLAHHRPHVSHMVHRRRRCTMLEHRRIHNYVICLVCIYVERACIIIMLCSAWLYAQWKNDSSQQSYSLAVYCSLSTFVFVSFPAISTFVCVSFPALSTFVFVSFPVISSFVSFPTFFCQPLWFLCNSLCCSSLLFFSRHQHGQPGPRSVSMTRFCCTPQQAD